MIVASNNLHYWYHSLGSMKWFPYTSVLCDGCLTITGMHLVCKLWFLLIAQLSTYSIEIDGIFDIIEILLIVQLLDSCNLFNVVLYYLSLQMS